MGGTIRVGVGGWTYEPWRGVFYPAGLPQNKELEFLSRAVRTLEINGTYFSLFKRTSWEKWYDETPDDFVFAVKGSRFSTNRKILASAGESVERFLDQGITALGNKLGPINWQLAGTKKLEVEDVDAFLTLLPTEKDGIQLKHALEVRHASFISPDFYEVAAKHGAAIIYADDSTFPKIDQPTTNFTYARIMTTKEELAEGLTDAEFESLAQQAIDWAQQGDVFIYFISGAKVRNPAAALKLQRLVDASSEHTHG